MMGVNTRNIYSCLQKYNKLNKSYLVGQLLNSIHDARTHVYKIRRICYINLLKPTGHVMHHQFNIQQLYALPTLYLCVLYLSQNKQRLVPLTA